MDYVFGFAGIPRELQDAVHARNSEFARNAHVLLDAMPPGATYQQRNVDFFLGRLKAHASDEKAQPVSLAIFYLVKDEESTRFFVESFFPHTLMIPVKWAWETPSASLIKPAKSLVQELKKRTAVARDALAVLKDELISRASSTPWLLPTKNFKSKTLVPALRRIHDQIGEGFCVSTLLVRQRNAFVSKHSYILISGGAQKCFLDDRDIEFHPPGNDRHGYARDLTEHETHCLLAGRWRLGAPYDRLFHYDCQKGIRNLKGNFHGCHSAREPLEGKPHINISPNDHVRCSI